MTNNSETSKDEMIQPKEKSILDSPSAEGEGRETISDTSTELQELSERAILAALQPILVRLEQLEQTVVQLTATIVQLRERADLLPRQVRQLGNKVDDMTESVSEPRIRDLLGSFLLLYDLVEQMLLNSELDEASVKDYQVLRDQITQALQVNGVFPMTEAQRFDPNIHKAVETTPCLTPEEDGEISRVYRSGFRTDQRILRFTEVIVKSYQSK